MPEPQSGPPARTSPNDQPEPAAPDTARTPGARPRTGLFAVVVLLAALLVSSVFFVLNRGKANDAYIDSHMGIASELTKLELASMVERELVLIQKLSGSDLLTRFFGNTADPVLAELATAEINSYQRHLKNGCTFWAASDHVVHFCPNREDYLADPENPEHYWYHYVLNANIPHYADTTWHPDTNKSTIYIAVPVKSVDGTRILGVVGSAIDTMNIDERLFGAFELINRDFVYYIYDARYTIIATNGERSSIKTASVIETFPEIADQVVDVALAPHLGDRVLRRGDEVFLLTRIPDLNWFLLVHYELPPLGTINTLITRTFMGMLLVCALVVAAFYLYSNRLVRLIPAEAPDDGPEAGPSPRPPSAPGPSTRTKTPTAAQDDSTQPPADEASRGPADQAPGAQAPVAAASATVVPPGPPPAA